MALKSWCLLVATILLCESGCIEFPPCDSHIYCTGELLEQVQMAKIFNDDKYFVDMKLKKNPDIVWEAFQNLTTASPVGKPTKQQLSNFIQEYFEAPGQEFEKWIPDDWRDKDSYWIIKGLLISEMSKTAKGMIENFLHLIHRFGFIPNGGRVYYQRRSQPPFLTLMVESYILATNDTAFLMECIDLLDKEYDYWMKNRSVPVILGDKTHYLNCYNVEAAGPRPESFSKDVALGQTLAEAARQDLWVELKTGAESGWDFSSRWFIDSNGENNGTLKNTKTRQIIPVDLNSILCRNERILALFHEKLGNFSKAQFYKEAMNKRIDAVREVFWDNKQGIWFDYNLMRSRSNAAFYASNLAPLWAKCILEQVPGQTAEMVVRYLEKHHLLEYRNGIPTSLVPSGEQWDYPNAWPPLQQIIIEGLAKSKSERGQRIAFQQARRWIQSNWRLYKKHQAMYEKYDVNSDSQPGGGGEYDVQVGFGWTNGVVLQLLDEYGDQLTSGVMELTSFPFCTLFSICFLFLQLQ
ncbi:trehalase isoform X2 [Mobula birostris]|uniref:trehalase isoform X2 n=1 Tax=Mobula birostris TaxID=1983395 RepID=UPI003B28757C